MSTDGTILAVGAIYTNGNNANYGHVTVFRFCTETESWKQRGNEISGENSEDQDMWTISLSSDGSILAIGDYQDDSNGENSGNYQKKIALEKLF